MEIRQASEADRPALRELFPRAGAGSPTGDLWGDPESEAAVYLYPYLEREPESVFVAASDDGTLLGYLTGCVDSTTFPGEEKRVDAAIRRYGLLRRRTAVAFFGRAVTDTVWAKLRRQSTTWEFTDPRWPSHLHIDLAPEARGTGAAAGLMNRFLAHAKAAGSPGCYLQTVVENPRAVAFFRKMGFTAHGDTPIIPGPRYEGAKLHQLTMVRAL
ncbi:GNAT family N-acetyltransferase [Nocardia higoensis]|uniref:GNAT family N-acetyltransferase n=1 Tax=Nocardia higoensis TaxID=228599 RepID=UPI000303E87A|nr:GNAT family N-acetyltransferase [Nocardia higoensis]